MRKASHAKVWEVFLLLKKEKTMRIYQSMTEMIGRTPLLQLHKFEKKSESNARIYAKLEGFNPSGSGKDRIAHAMIRAAEAAGTL